LDQGRVDLDLAVRLDAARARAATLVGGKFDPAGAEPLYASAFEEAGLGQEGDDVEAVAARVRESAVSAELVAALDDWASMTPDRDRRKWLLAVARGCDQDPVRNRLRQPELWQDRARLTQLAGESSVAELSPQLATALGRVARECRADAVPLLTAAQARFPQDFWINFELGFALHRAHRSGEALGYYRSALALRPDVGVALNGVGAVLSNLGREDEAMGYLQQAVQLDPKNAWALSNLGNALRKKGQLHDALGLLQRAVSIDPTSGAVHNNLGLTLHGLGRVDEANDHYQEAIRCDPNAALPHSNLGLSLYEKDRDKAIECYRQAIALDPTLAVAYDALGRALRDKGRHEEAIDLIQQAVRIEPHIVPRQIYLAYSLYTGACGAVRAAARQGSAAAPPGEPDAAAQRRKALDWLRADLDLAARLERDGHLVGRPPAMWPKDPALASVRDSAALAKLPDAERKQWQRLWVDVAAVRAADPLEQGRELAEQREWAEAADGYARALALGPTDDGHFWFEYAAVLLLAGDHPGYERACAHMVERCGKPGGPRPYHMARACSLAPDAVADAALPARLAAMELQDNARQFWSLTEQGALAYRAGQFEQAVPLFEQSLKAESAVGRAVLNWLWLALANQGLGESDEARRWLGEAQAWLDQYRDGMPDSAEQEFGLHFHNWLEANALRREAEALMQPAEKSP
jgi:tetratricopeptide (TPR) repeat protein